MLKLNKEFGFLKTVLPSQRSPAQTLGLWVRISLEAWMSLRVFSVFVFFDYLMTLFYLHVVLYHYFDVVVGLERSHELESYAGGSVVTEALPCRTD
jgi:hypothetical protein